jgi:tetratricopeptide (TPR) repeat protein
MPQYLWNCTSPEGKETAVRIEAADATEARQRLQGQGYTNLQLLTDECYAAAKESFGADARQVSLSAEQEAAFFRQPSTSFLRLLGQSLRFGLLLYLVLAAIVAFRVARSAQWRTMDTIYVVIAVAFTLWIAFKSSGSYLFAKLNEAKDWHQWDEVLRQLRRIETFNRFTWGKLPPSTIARYRAEALAAKGQVQTALQVLEIYRHTEGMPEWLFLAYVAGIYDRAKDFDHAIEYNRQAIAADPGKAALLVDLAFRLIFRKRDVPAARQAIAEAEQHEQTVMAKPFQSRVRGLIALEEGDYATARDYFARALDLLLPFQGKPLVFGNLMLTSACLALAEAKLGHRAAAQALLQKATPYLEATEEKDLLQRCRAAL